MQQHGDSLTSQENLTTRFSEDTVRPHSLFYQRPGMNPALARYLGAVKDLYCLSQTSVSTILVMLLALVIRLHFLMRHGVWVNVVEAVKTAEVAFNYYFPSSSLPLSPTSPMLHLPGNMSWPCSLSQTVGRIKPHMVFSRHVRFLFVYLFFPSDLTYLFYRLANPHRC